MMQGWHLGLMLALTAAMSGWSGCVASNDPPPQPALPLFHDLDSHSPPPPPEAPPPPKASPAPATNQPPTTDATSVDRTPIIARIRRIEFPFFQTDLAPARELVQRHNIPLDQIDLWRANGIFVGIVNPADQPRFLQALPPNLGGEQSRLVSLAQSCFLPLTPSLTRPANLTVTLPDGREHPLRLAGGRCQFILRFHKTTDRQVLIECIPHHHLPKISIIPRLPQEKALDGRIFQELTLNASIQPGQWLVLGIEPNARPEPPPEVPVTQPSVEAHALKAWADVPTTAPDTQPAINPDRPSRFATSAPADATMNDRNIPDTLGVMLLGLLRHNKPIQTLLVISVEE